MIQLRLANLVFLNFLGEDTTKKLWYKLGNIYRLKSLANSCYFEGKFTL